MEMLEVTPEQAIDFYNSGEWNWWSDRQRAEFQMRVERLCMPFSIFHASISRVLNRSVYTHEFGLNWDGLMAELFDGAESPSIVEILDMLPKDKPLMVVVPDAGG